jgi:Na+/melibiose symporter-like transporter
MLNSYSADSRTTFRRADYVKITIFGFALTALWQSVHSIILPLGLLTLAGLLLAIIVQPIAGALSDRSSFAWGRRKPFILLGGMLALLLIPGIGLAGSYAAIFVIYCLLQVSTNTAQGPYQAFIPELVPDRKRGLASGVKTLFEILGGVAVIYPVAIFMDRYFAGEGSQWLWLVLVILAIVLLGAMVATVAIVREPPITVSHNRTPLLATLRRTFKIDTANHDFIWFLVSRLLIYMAFTTIQQFMLNFLRDVIGVTNPAEATVRFSLLAVAGMLAVVYPAGYLSDRIGRKPVTISAGLLGAVGIGMIFSSQDYGSMLPAAGAIGVAIGAFNSSNWALATDLIPKREEARYLGLTNLATAGGAALARAIGPAIDFFNSYSPVFGYRFMLMVCLVYFIVGSALVVKIKRPC